MCAQPEGRRGELRGPGLPTMMLKSVKDATGQRVADHGLNYGWQTTKPVKVQVGQESVGVGRVTRYKGLRQDVLAAPLRSAL